MKTIRDALTGPARTRPAGRLAPDGQRGIILAVTLIVLLILIVSGIALVRSVTGSQLLIGNLALKRDQINQAEHGVAIALTEFQIGGSLATAYSRLHNLQAANYSACYLPSNTQGIPNILVDNNLAPNSPGSTDIGSGSGCGGQVGQSSNDYVDPGNSDTTNRMTIRYLIDRLCANTGVFNETTCSLYASQPPNSGSPPWGASVSGQTYALYRLTVRVTQGNTQTYMQTTFSSP